MTHPRTLMTVAAVGALSLSLAACSGGDPASDATAEPGSSEETTTVTVGIDIPFHPLYAYLAANTDEVFAGTPYDVEFEVLDATTLVPAFGAGDIDVVTTTPSFMPRILDQYGVETQYFFPMARWTPGTYLMVPPDSDAESLEDLRGATVATPPLSSRFGAEEAVVLAVTGEDIREYFSLVETEAAAQEIALGRADAVLLEAPANAELIADGYKTVFTLQEGLYEAFGEIAEYPLSGGFIAGSEFASENPGFVDALVAATQDTWDLFQSDPDAVLGVASEYSGLPVEQLELVSDILYLADMPADMMQVTEGDVELWGEIWELLAETGFNTAAPEDPSAWFIVSAE